jgi:hypothetical protein
MLFLSHLQTLATIQESCSELVRRQRPLCAEASEISRGCWPSKPDPMYGLSSSGSVSTRRQADFMLPPAQSPLVALADRPSHGDRDRGRNRGRHSRQGGGKVAPLLTARTSGRHRTSSMKRASKGEVLSLLHTRDIVRGMFKSSTGRMATVLGHRHRALPRTHPTPKPVDTRLRIVASLNPS